MDIGQVWQPDWDAIAQHMVQRTFGLQPGERVVYLVDPGVYPELLESVRGQVLTAGGVDQAALLTWTPRLASLRTPAGQARDPAAAERERQAHLEVLNTADVFIWLPNDSFYGGSYTVWESEWMLARWQGRGVHFHWFADPGTQPDDPINTALAQAYQRGILELDYAWLAARQRRLVEALRGRRLRVTTPQGTDLSFDMPADGWYHCNDGDASRARATQAVCARDREQELPCGAVRSIPAPESANGIISLRQVPAWNGVGLDLDRFGSQLDLVFRDGRVVELRGGPHQSDVTAQWAAQTGDKDRLGEIVFGTNPLLGTPPGARLPTYWGFGDGKFRLHLGDNVESSGSFTSSLWINLFLSDATVEVDGEPMVSDGKLVGV